LGRLVGQRHFGVDRREYKHEAQASESGRNALTRLRFVLVMPATVALSSWFALLTAGLSSVPAILIARMAGWGIAQRCPSMASPGAPLRSAPATRRRIRFKILDTFSQSPVLLVIDCRRVHPPVEALWFSHINAWPRDPCQDVLSQRPL
jgi:hypothetical protein